MKLCPCGSGQPRRDLRDAAGIFCTFVCDACEKAKRARFNPAIFDQSSDYAVTGEEADIDDLRDAERRHHQRIADHIDGYDRDDLGESPDY